ncbi:enoyl-CoA hydratase/isomerase family protein [Chitinophaga silvisoli]|uniref:Enoyl-CoA hydratase/isomerase family protein n=1 Tax=Chitinophaga silvisoli TaxID=2291814 RepID=A0A3E1NSQ5_9BACT|nr:enoyl-CoA hydratase/isomerase family protein [Chitinophaga silvisoli]RFM30798.1 enoyl-CoA hydratase/isomerase family protein [Chitinophaga silvisoli]
MDKLNVDIRNGVAFASINNPPLNVLDASLMISLGQFVASMQEDKTVKVIVFQSADPDFFIAHGDTNYIVDPTSFASLASPEMLQAPINPMQHLHEQIRQLSQVTIAVIDGFVRGGGAELALACDMRFASLEKARFGQPETLMGIIPGGGGTQYLTRLIGRARTMEVIVGGELLDGVMAEKYGLVNRALPQADLYNYVNALATRIAKLPEDVADYAVKAIDAASGDLYEGLTLENQLCMGLFARPATVARAKVALAAGVQTREGEKDLEGILNKL